MSGNKLLFIDVETTGTDPFRHGLIQISGCVQIDDQIKEAFDYFVRPFPNDQIEDEALQVTGIDRRQLLPEPDPQHLAVPGQEFLDPQDVYARLAVMFGRYIDKFDRGDKFQFVGYNAHSFDMPFLRRFWEKNGDRFFGSWFWYPCLDVMLVWAQILLDERARLPNFKLASVARHCGLQVDDSRLHDSGYDIELTRDLWLAARKVIERGRDPQPLWVQGQLF
ncbi:MAG: 3'-5' exonuclease [Desulfuromonadales bacterium]|nr:3'-5' exonuclease [Desulfuromonadales bacterium]